MNQTAATELHNIHTRPLPVDEEMYAAVTAKDSRYEGIFFTAVKTTGIFCRPSCPARKPKRANVEFFSTAGEALAHGYRPCKRCRPLEPRSGTPAAIQQLLRDIETEPERRLRDIDLRARGVEPASLRRWFKQHHGMTFHAYQRARRLANAMNQLSRGDRLVDVAYDSGYESLSGFHAAIQQITGRTAAGSRNATIVYLSRALTPLGPMLLGATDKAVCLLEFVDRRMLETQLARVSRRLDCVFVPKENAITRQMEEELAMYFSGDLQTFTTPTQSHGTAFQQRAWAALRRIPYGTTRSYAEQATMIGAPTAVRAVARANGDNRIAIVIPCHRVIGADRTLTGYGGGLWRKRWLLHHEGVLFQGDKVTGARA